MAFVHGTQEMNVYYEQLAKICEGYERNDEILQNISMYEFVMTSVASVLGNIGEYEKSDLLSNKILRECVRCGRFGTIASNIYSIAWNYKEKNDTTYSRERWEVAVKVAAKLFHIEKNYNSEKFLISNL